jgi:hypothetical protein
MKADTAAIAANLVFIATLLRFGFVAAVLSHAPKSPNLMQTPTDAGFV